MKPMTEQMKTTLASLKECGPGWHDVSPAMHRQFKALARRGLVEHENPSRGPRARLVQQKKDRLWSLAEVRARNMEAGFYFFSRDTMRFFGDTMRSFAVRNRPDGVFIERLKPMRTRDGRDMGGVGSLYRFDPDTGHIGSVSRGDG